MSAFVLTATKDLANRPANKTKPQVKNPRYLFSDVVIVGAGMAGSRMAIKLAKLWQLHNVDKSLTLISKEPEVGYNRIMLSPVLAGETRFEETYMYDHQQYEQLGIRVMAGVSVEKIDTTRQQLFLDSKECVGYGKLILATGSLARVIPLPNHTAHGVHVFRDVADVAVLSEYAKQGKTGLIIGGGVLGLEAACALSSRGAETTVVHVADHVLNRQLDLTAALLLQQELAQRNIGVEVSVEITAIEVNANNQVVGLKLKDGKSLPADFIVMTVGIIPNIQLAMDSGIEVNRGIKVDPFMQSSCHNVYAIGECVEIKDELFGMVSSVNEHIEVLLQVLSHPNSRAKWTPFITVPLALKLKVSGIAVFSSGKIEFDESEWKAIEKIIYKQAKSKHYHCLYIKDNLLVGAILYGETSEGSFYHQLIHERIDIYEFKQELILGAAYCQPLLKPDVKIQQVA